MAAKIEIPKQLLADFCRHNGIKRLALFGSVLREDFTAESDIDMLVEFQEGVRVGLSFFRMERELSELLGRKVDLNTAGFLSRDFREQVQRVAEVLYDAA